jgi:hypothetical protein
MRETRLKIVSRLSREIHLRRLNSQFHNELGLNRIDRAISCLNRIYDAEGGAGYLSKLLKTQSILFIVLQNQQQGANVM